jgi:hypothetical protein
MNYSQVKNPVWSNPEQTTIDCLVLFNNQTEFLPFTAVPDGEPPYCAQIYAECVAGQYGPVAPYAPPVPPPPPPPDPPTAEENKARAVQRLMETDWVNQPDVIDPNVNPHLLNHSEFISYRAALRTIAVIPRPGFLIWPVKPSEQWST